MHMVLGTVGALILALGAIVLALGIDGGSRSAVMETLGVAAPLLIGGLALIGLAAVLRRLDRIADALEAVIEEREEAPDAPEVAEPVAPVTGPRIAREPLAGPPTSARS